MMQFLTLAVLCSAKPGLAGTPTAVERDERSKVEVVARQPRTPDIVADETATQNGPIRATGASQVFVQAQRAHDAGVYVDAALKWNLIAQRATPDDREHREIAEYQLGVALARLGLSLASVHWFLTAAESPQHTLHASALVQLARIAEGLSDIWTVLPQFSSYSLSDLDALRQLQNDEHMTLAYWVGLGRYHAGDYSQAQRAFARVQLSNPHFLEARLFESACHVRQRHSVQALRSLARGVAAIEQGNFRVLEQHRWLDLLHLSQGRIYYSSAVALDPETNIPKINQLRISAAVKYYNLLEPESEYFPEATFELAWVYFMAGQYSFSLGKLFTLDAPYYSRDFHPEAQILKAVLYQANCSYDAATIIQARFNKRYVPIRDEIKKLLRQFNIDEPGRLARVVSEIRLGSAALGSTLEATVVAAHRERSFLRMLRAAGAVEDEIARFDALPTSLKASALGEQLRDVLALRRQAAASRADQWLHAFLQRRVDEIDEHIRNGEKILINQYAFSRNLLDVKLKSGQVSKADSNDWGRVSADEEHVIWPFDGEYWRDELGTYRQTLLSTCGR